MTLPLRWLDFKVTNRCNNACEYCGVAQDPPSAPECLDAETVIRALDDAVGCGFQSICLLGGEPTVRDDLPAILARMSRHPDLHLMMITNLKRYREDVVEALFATECAEARIVASLDSLQAPTYKRVTPDVALDHIARMQARARAHSRPGRVRGVDVHAVISRENWDRVEPFVLELDRRGLDVSLGLVCPTVVTETPGRCNELSRAELRAVADQLERLDRRGKLAFANQVLLEYVRERDRGIPAQRHECTAGRHQVIVNPDGEVYPCITESYRLGLRFGNIRHDRLHRIYARLQQFRCQRAEEAACWDHYLWTRLVRRNAEDTTTSFQEAADVAP